MNLFQQVTVSENWHTMPFKHSNLSRIAKNSSILQWDFLLILIYLSLHISTAFTYTFEQMILFIYSLLTVVKILRSSEFVRKPSPFTSIFRKACNNSSSLVAGSFLQMSQKSSKVNSSVQYIHCVHSLTRSHQGGGDMRHMPFETGTEQSTLKEIMVKELTFSTTP